MATDAELRSKLIGIASDVETLVRSISADEAERSRIASAMARIATKKAGNG